MQDERNEVIHIVEIIKIIKRPEMDKYTSITKDTNIIHTDRWKEVPFAEKYFKDAPVPGLMGASILEQSAEEFLQKENTEIYLAKMTNSFFAPLYCTEPYCFLVELKTEGFLKASIIKKNEGKDERNFRSIMNYTSNPLKEENVDEKIKPSSEIKLTPEQLDEYIKLIGNKKGHIPSMFSVSATASQAMFQKFREKAQGKVYFKFDVDFFNAINALQSEKDNIINTYVSDITMQKDKYSVNIVAGIAGRKLYSATAQLVNLSDLVQKQKA